MNIILLVYKLSFDISVGNASTKKKYHLIGALWFVLSWTVLAVTKVTHKKGETMEKEINLNLLMKYADNTIGRGPVPYANC